MSATHPVAIRRAVFCMVWSLEMEVLEVMVDHAGLAYSIMGRVIALKVWVIVSMDLPHLVVVSDLRMFVVFLAFSAVFLM